MAKSSLTKEIEEWVLGLGKQNLICQEVSVSKYMQGNRHKFVDIMEYNRYKNEFTCYEIKVSKEDLYSKNGHNFVGDRNYYVVPANLKKVAKQKVKNTDIGVMVYNNNEKIEIPVEAKKKFNTRKTKYFLLLTLSKAIKRENEKLKQQLEETKKQHNN